MNIMLANVRSRIREIGIRKALGATYREIKLQFLTEAVLISLSGGVVGSLVGLADSAFPSASSRATTFPISWLSVIIALTAADARGRRLRHRARHPRRADEPRGRVEV